MALSILEALREPQLFGGFAPFRDLGSWSAWEAFLAGVYGLPMSEAQLVTFAHHTGRNWIPPGGFKEVVCVVGRQSGKSRVAALIAAYEAITATAEEDGTDLYKQALVTRNADSLILNNGVTVAAYPCRPAAIRGLRARVAVCDELAFFSSAENTPQDTEMLRALRPTLATTGGKLIILSSPYGQSGALWDLYRKHYRRDDSPVLIWQATAPEMNPALPSDYLERMKQDDPEAYRSEVLGEFRAGISNLFDPDALDACVARERRELQPAEGVTYFGFADPSGGGKDAFTVSIAHRTEERVVVDCVRAWTPPFNPSGVVAEAAKLVRDFRMRRISGDRYAGEWPREAFRSHGIEYEVADLNRSELYLELLPIVNARGVELPDDPKLLRELRALERHRGSSGRDRVDHRPGSHDDRANAVAGAVLLAAKKDRSIMLPVPICLSTGPAPWEELGRELA